MNTITIRITSKCNYACGMCPYHGDDYKEDYFNNRPEFNRDMTLGEFEEILKKSKEAGVEKINLTPNGEFFTYKKWREVLALIQKYGMQSTLTTNGGLLSEQDIKDAIDLGLSHVAVSIDSVHYDTYKIVRKPATKKAFENAINAPILFKQYSNNMRGGGAFMSKVQFTEQPENKQEVRDMLDFYRPHKLDQISVIKMSKYYQGGSVISGAEKPLFKIGACKSYGSYIVAPNGNVIGCCEEAFVYPKIKSKVPNIFKQSLEECQKQSDYLYLNDSDFIDYCRNCSIYATSDSEVLEKKFIESGYFAMQYSTQTRYFNIPEYLKSIPEDVLLFMYENGMVSKIKQMKRINNETNHN